MIYDFLEKKCSENGIRVAYEKFKPHTPSCASQKNKCIVINKAWHRPTEVPFQFAHELAHILYGEEADLVFYHANYNRHSKVEHQANVGAIKLLIEYAELNDIPLHTISNDFGVPSSLSGIVEEEIGKYRTN